MLTVSHIDFIESMPSDPAEMNWDTASRRHAAWRNRGMGPSTSDPPSVTNQNRGSSVGMGPLTTSRTNRSRDPGAINFDLALRFK